MGEAEILKYADTRLHGWTKCLIELAAAFKMIRKFFLNHNKSFRWHLGDYEKHIFFHLKACERRNFDFFFFFQMCSISVKKRYM